MRKLFGSALLAIGVFLLVTIFFPPAIAYRLLSQDPYNVTEYWKIEKTVYPPCGAIAFNYQRAWKCSSNWVGSSWVPIVLASSATEALNHLTSVNSNLHGCSLISSSENSDCYYFTLSVQYSHAINGQVQISTYNDDGALYNGQIVYTVYYSVTHRVYAEFITNGLAQNSVTFEFPANSYIIWATSEDGRKSGNATLDIVDGGCYKIKFILSPQSPPGESPPEEPPSQQPPDQPPPQEVLSLELESTITMLVIAFACISVGLFLKKGK